MSKPLSGWVDSTIGEQCDVIAGQSPEGKFYNDAGIGLPFYQGKKEFGEKYIGPPNIWTSHITKEAYSGDILMSVRAPVGPINFSTQNICIGRGLAAIRAGDGIDKEFLFYTLMSLQNEIIGNEGAVFASINKKQIENIKLSHPPLPEQKRIVAILDEAFAGIARATANTEKNLANARELFESYLNNVFTQRGEGWVDKKLSSLCYKITVGHVGKMASKYIEQGIPFLRSQNIQPFRVVLDNVKYIDDDFHSSLPKSALQPSDVVIVRTGYPGTAAVIPQSLPFANCSDLVIAKPKEILSPYYLATFMNSSYGKKKVGVNLVGAAQKHYNVSAAKNIDMPLPPLEEQQTIVSNVEQFLKETQHLEAIYQKKLTALAELKQSILQKAFTGELTANTVEQ